MLKLGRLSPAILALAALLVPAAAGSTAGPQTTAPTILVRVRVTITDSKISVSPKRAPRGSDAQFIVRNKGRHVHHFTLGTAKRGTGVQTGFSRAIPPGGKRTLLLYLNYRGKLPYFSSTPADRKKPKMHGTFTVAGSVSGSVDG